MRRWNVSGALHGIIVIDKARLLRIIRGRTNVVVVTFGQFFLLARGEHALDRDTDGHDAQGGGPIITENGSAYMAVGIDMGMHGWLDHIGNDELHSRRLERILWIEPDHEMKDFILVQTVPENLYRKIPRLEILGLEQLDTSCSLRGIGLFYLDLLQLLLQPSRVDDGHG